MLCCLCGSEALIGVILLVTIITPGHMCVKYSRTESLKLSVALFIHCPYLTCGTWSLLILFSNLFVLLSDKVVLFSVKKYHTTCVSPNPFTYDLTMEPIHHCRHIFIFGLSAQIKIWQSQVTRRNHNESVHVAKPSKCWCRILETDCVLIFLLLVHLHITSWWYSRIDLPGSLSQLFESWGS